MTSVDLGMPTLPPREERPPIYLSNSSIQTFKNCRRRFWLTHYRKLRPKEEKAYGALALGTRIHLALEIWYGEKHLVPTTSNQRLLDIWSALVDKDRLGLESSGGFMEDFDHEAELGRVMLEGYAKWLEDEGIDSSFDIISQEEVLQKDLLDGQVILIGKVDQRVRRRVDGAKFIRDFKTAASFADLEKTIEMNEQFLTYMVLEYLLLDDEDRVGGAIVTGLRKVKRGPSARPPFYSNIEVSHNIFTLRNFYRRLIGVLQDIVDMWRDLEDGADPMQVAYPHPTRDCSWSCPFYLICPMFDNGSAVEQAIADRYVETSPFEYYGDSDPTKEKS